MSIADAKKLIAERVRGLHRRVDARIEREAPGRWVVRAVLAANRPGRSHRVSGRGRTIQQATRSFITNAYRAVAQDLVEVR